MRAAQIHRAGIVVALDPDPATPGLQLGDPELFGVGRGRKRIKKRTRAEAMAYLRASRSGGKVAPPPGRRLLSNWLMKVQECRRNLAIRQNKSESTTWVERFTLSTNTMRRLSARPFAPAEQLSRTPR